MGSYNFLGLAVRYDESMRTVKDVLEEYGVGVASTRHEMGMYVHHFEIFSSWVSDSLWLFLKCRSFLDRVTKKLLDNSKGKRYMKVFMEISNIMLLPSSLLIIDFSYSE